ncbi:MAG: sarcosine oxidase subunit gamma [bacterium]
MAEHEDMNEDMNDDDAPERASDAGDANGIEPTAPCRHREPIEGRTRLRQLPWRGKINLRGDADDARFHRRVARALEVSADASALPRKANRAAMHDDLTAFWLGPNEWLLHCPPARADSITRRLREQLAPLHHAVTEVTDYYTVLELAGEHAVAALARGCPLDLHAREFTPGQCAQSRFGHASILLHKLPPRDDAEPLFHLQVRWSFAEYVWAYLARVISSLPATSL